MTFWTRRRLGLAALVVFVLGVVAAAVNLRLGNETSTTVPPNSVAALDPRTGRLDASIAVGVGPDAVAVGGGAVWVANSEDQTVSRIDAGALALVRTIPVGEYPSAVATGAGAVWVASGPLGRLVKIDPGSNRASRARSAGSKCGGLEASLAIGAGSLWLACDLAPSAVRVDPVSRSIVPFAYRAGLLTGPSGTVVPHFSAVAFGDGVLWIADRAQDRVTAIDPSTNLAVRQISVGREPVSVAVGYGWIWVANAQDGTVSRIEVGAPGRPPRVETIAVGARPVGVAAGEGAIWVANAGGRSVSRLDPETGRVTATVELGNTPAGIATGAGRVWVTVGTP